MNLARNFNHPRKYTACLSQDCRIILGIKKFDHVSASRKSLCWLNVRQKLLLNTVTMVQKSRRNQTPPYLCNLFHCPRRDFAAQRRNPEEAPKARKRYLFCGYKRSHQKCEKGTFLAVTSDLLKNAKKVPFLRLETFL